jgi:single-strand DNA-binding protein
MNGAQISFFGRLTRDPEMRYGRDNGTSYATVGVANNYWPRAGQEPETTFFEVTLWGHNAQHCVGHCQKGDEVFIQGVYTFREYTRRDGRPGYSHQVNAREFRRFASGPALRLRPRLQG